MLFRFCLFQCDVNKDTKAQTDLQHKPLHTSGNCTSHDHLDWSRLSDREELKHRDEEADRGNDGKTTWKSGLALNGISYHGKPRTVRSGVSSL